MTRFPEQTSIRRAGKATVVDYKISPWKISCFEGGAEKMEQVRQTVVIAREASNQ